MFDNKTLPAGTKVNILPGAGLPHHLKTGKVVGIMLQGLPILGRCYAVDVLELVSAEYPYSVVGVFEVHLTIPQ